MNATIVNAPIVATTASRDPAFRPMRDTRGRGTVRAWMLPVSMGVLLPLVGLLAAWPLAAGWLSPDLADRWTRALLATADVGAFRDLTGTAYPLLPLAADMLLALLPGLGGMPPPLLVNVLAVTLAAGLWVRMMAAGGHGFAWAVITAGLLLLQPALALSVAGGGPAVPGLLFFTIVVSSALRLHRAGEVNAMIGLGVALAGLAVTDAAGAYMVLAAIPFLALLLPPRMVATSASGSLLVVLFPLLFAALALFYVNWVFGGSPLAFAAGVDAAIRGAAGDIGGSRWLMGPGAGFGGALTAGAALLLLSGPLLLAGIVLGDAGARRVLVLLAALLLVAIVLASATRFLGDPGRVLAYLPPVCALAAAIAGRQRLPGAAVAVLALAGLLGGWWGQGWSGDAQSAGWRAALHGPVPQPDERAGQVALGRFLRPLDDVAIDGLTAGAAVPARGTARGLVLPSNDRLKADLITGRLRSAHLALRDPSSPAGARDRIAQARPGLWLDAGPGARLLYDRDGWRVWRLADGDDMSGVVK
ncbi:hypothetical protein [Niveispirillum fermenti]|uniref:hypothetical protein n=1 Tax=Niveispirillum fermenti TaxID=1233113 RepID=UPI003A8BD275